MNSFEHMVRVEREGPSRVSGGYEPDRFRVREHLADGTAILVDEGLLLDAANELARSQAAAKRVRAVTYPDGVRA